MPERWARLGNYAGSISLISLSDEAGDFRTIA
jgi:hypothetical protein